MIPTTSLITGRWSWERGIGHSEEVQVHRKVSDEPLLPRSYPHIAANSISTVLCTIYIL